MKCQQETFVVSSSDGTCFFFWGRSCWNEMSTRDISCFKLLWNLFLFLLRRLELDLFELQELYAEKAEMAGYLARDDDAMEDVAKEILGISLELFGSSWCVFFER